MERAARHLVDFVLSAELATLLVVALLLLWFGKKSVADHPSAERAVKSASGLAFAVAVLAVLTGHAPVAGSELETIFRALFATGCGLGLGWIVVPIGTGLFDRTIGATQRSLRKAAAAVRERWQRSRRRHREQRERQERERTAPQREKAQQQRTQQAADDQRRRDSARVRCELLFATHTPLLGDRFPRAGFDHFINNFMTDAQPPQVVEERAAQLQAMILQHVERIEPPQQPHSIETLTDWYQRTRATLINLPETTLAEGRFKQTQFANLNKRYAELMQELMEQLRP